MKKVKQAVVLSAYSAMLSGVVIMAPICAGLPQPALCPCRHTHGYNMNVCSLHT